MINKIIFAISLGAVTLTVLALIWSAISPQKRLWPPQEQMCWGKYAILILFNTAAISLIFLGILDWGSFIIPVWVRVLGAILSVTGQTIALWAVITLGLSATTGHLDKFIRHGPYRVSRNPQYVGFMIALIGWSLLTNSLLTCTACLLSTIPLMIVPIVEEPWLREKYGEEYDPYLREVPRYLPFKVKK